MKLVIASVISLLSFSALAAPEGDAQRTHS